MKIFLRGGRGMAIGQSCVRPLADEKSLSSRPKKEKIKYPLSNCRPFDKSEQVLHYGPRKIGTQRGNGNMIRLMAFILPMIIFCVLFSNAFAQSAGERAAVKAQHIIKPLQVGDTIPEDLWNLPLQVVNHRDGKETITLSDYRYKKLIILDFWATWCSSCIQKFSKLYSLQQERDRLQVLLVNTKSTRDSPKKVYDFLTKRKEAYQLTSIVNDTVLSSFFPQYSLPHYVFLNEGKIVAVINANQVSSLNWDKVADGDYSVETKIYKEYDVNKPLFKDGNGGNCPDYIFSSFLSGYVDGIPSQIYRGGELTDRVSFINLPLITILKYAYPSLRNFSSTRMRYNVADPFLYSERVIGETRNLFTYEIKMPLTSLEKVDEYIRQDIKRYFLLNFSIKKESQDCWVLSSRDSKKVLDFPETLTRATNLYEETGASIFYDNYPLQNLIKYLEEKYKIPFIDETGILANVRLELPGDIGNINELQESLKRFGLLLKKERRDIDVMVISNDLITN
ncbi:TlpA family protein disulfide reductase [Sphingobacterium faecale]|uniref:TlpA family protein disulfide reductase n=1 Tax=Sphingobacterium faecale TaxID=2803775 RepID=A0ABS1QZK9_9SPHI|nr:TlpA disulfide reductase family protein [Sphingobacterium faecale]MBL1407515.1 TlpA family protein disulfide reductase [Sphingobacterium faecale]